MTQQYRLLTVTDGQIIEGDGYPNTGGGNEELQYYKKENVSFIGLTTISINAKEELCFSPQNRGYSFSSGRLHSKVKISLSKKGKLEAFISAPTIAGMGPAFWILPVKSEYPGPACGEIDIMEAKGRLPFEYFGSVHYLGQGQKNKHTQVTFNKKMPEKITSIKGFHKYGLEGDEDNIKWYGNDQLIRSVEKKVIIEASVNKKIFEEDFYIVVNLAAGGLFDNWYRPNPTDLPCKMLVKDVKYYIFD